MTTNDLVYKIAERAKVLANQSIRDLRLYVGGANEDTVTAALRAAARQNRGDLIEEILCDEFCEEFPKEIAEE